MDKKHTPGPWRWTDGENDIDISTYESPGYFDNPVLKGLGNAYESAVIGCGEYDILYGKDEEQRIANARLIAAAPDLLEALQELIDRLFLDLPQTEDFEVIKNSRAAIAKATQP